VRVLSNQRLGTERLGAEMQSLFLTPRNARAIRDRMPGADWQDVPSIVNALRLVKSPLETACTRKDALAADAGTMFAIKGIRDGATHHEVSA
jgi:Xaa-Pro aminopeptidase